METFVVRVYRTEQDGLPDDGRLRGVVEAIGSGSQATFHDIAELQSILRGRPHQRPGAPSGGEGAPGDRSQPTPSRGLTTPDDSQPKEDR